jgi:BirA family biotin operon repressor/biotin-[acetyl-CoA-carboxylase] ligase
VQSLSWPIDELRVALAALLAGCNVEVLPEIDSTNTELMRRARAGNTSPVLLVAQRQTAGRGRLGRPWLSADVQDTGGALTFSLGLPLAPRDWSGLSLAVGVSVADSVDAGGERVRLKWPNDLWLDERKLGGILIETAWPQQAQGSDRYLVIGIGLNLAPRAAEGLATPPAWLRELDAGATAPDVLRRIGPPLVAAVLRFGQAGFAPFAARFAARDALAGREVVLSDGTAGRAQGVADNGALLVQGAGGIVPVTSAELSVRPQADR